MDDSLVLNQVASVEGVEANMEVDEAASCDPEQTTESRDSQPEEEQTADGGDIESSDNIRFNPPAYLQRYHKVHNVLEMLLAMPKYKNMNASTGKTILEVGCAEFGMLRFLKDLLDIGKIIFADLDKPLLEEKAHLLRPLPAEYLLRKPRPVPLRVEAYAGCVTKVDADIQQNNPDVFAVVGIEIIEHLHADVLRGFEEAVFGVICPHFVIVTTPNSDFNEVFSLPPGKFRHWDHKFEWSRSEFKTWCDKIVAEFPMYTYSIDGICEGPEETKHLGFVSQMAVFERQGNLTDQELVSIRNASPFRDRVQQGAYTLVQSIDYPNYIETRSPEEITLDEFRYFVTNFFLCKSLIDEYEEEGMEEVTLSLERIQQIHGIPQIVKDNQIFLRSILEGAGYPIVEEDDKGPCVLFNIQAYRETYFEKDEDYMSEEEAISQDLNFLDVNKQELLVPEESWD